MLSGISRSMICDARVLPSGPVGAVRVFSETGVNCIGWEKGFGMDGLAGNSGRLGPVCLIVEDESGPLTTLAGAALADLNRDCFF